MILCILLHPVFY